MFIEVELAYKEPGKEKEQQAVSINVNHIVSFFGIGVTKTGIVLTTASELQECLNTYEDIQERIKKALGKK